MASEFYITRQGETWDEIALERYGSESYADALMMSNYDLLDTLVFSAGATVYTPDLDAEPSEDTPPWIDDGTTEGAETDPYA